MAHDPSSDRLDDLEMRVQRIERLLGPACLAPTPGFDPLVFHRTFMGYYVRAVVLLLLLSGAVLALVIPLATGVSPSGVTPTTLFGLPLCVTGDASGPFPVTVAGLPVGIFALHGIGLVSVGGLAVGGLAIGGGAVGVFAIGGGAIGLVAFGGGAIGLLACGGGAFGYIAIGGGAFGRYVLAGDGKGRYVFDRRRQDAEAVELFCRWMPKLREAFAGPSEQADG
ncbi:MAG TPA: hypothetical protein VML55_18865 [Planctomycetaceae bacterium]|nr:hypothetical protein [Planctomycetaceae bacterium]